MGSAASPLPYQNITTTSDLPQWKKELYGFTKNAPEYSPFKALSRQAGTQAKMIEGMTSAPKWSSMYAAMGVQPGTDLTPYIQAMRTGTQAPMTPIPASPAASDIPKYAAPSKQETQVTAKAATGGLMSLAKKRGFATGGASVPKDISAGQANSLAKLQKLVDANQKLTPQQQKSYDYLTQTHQAYTTYQNQQNADSSAPGGVPLSQAMNVVTPFFDPTQMQGQYAGVTNPIYQRAIDQLNAVSQAPSQFGQATGIMQSAADKLMAQAGYTPQQIQAAQINRGNIRDVAAQQAAVERMQGGPNVQAIKARAAQMAGPESWTSPGTAQQYMSPYQQAVTEQNLFEAQRASDLQQNQLNSQAAQQKAYGGTRAALQQSEANRNLGYKLADIQAQGANTAYQQGLQQFNTAQGQGLQAGQANLGAQMQANLANQQAGMSAQQLNQLYGQGGFQTQAANQAAQNQAYNNYVQQMLTAQGMNQGMDWNTANQNAQLQQQAAIQNQQAGLTAQGLNLQALNQAGQMGQGIGSLGAQQWQLQQNIPQMWGAAGQTAQGIAQQAATGAQQTAQNWWGGMNAAYTPVTNMLTQTPGATGTQATARQPGV